MTLKARIQEDMKSAMRAGEKEKLANIRMLMAAVKQREVDERVELDDAQVLSVIDKMVKQRRESIAQFAAGGRSDLVAKEEAELRLLGAYLPEPLTEGELDVLINEAVAATGASTIKDMGKVMAAIKAKAAGRADKGAGGARIKTRLSS